MVREEGSRWDVGTRDNVITLERFDDSDERVSEDVLEVDEARELAALLTKHADRIESSGDGDTKDKDSKADDTKNEGSKADDSKDKDSKADDSDSDDSDDDSSG